MQNQAWGLSFERNLMVEASWSEVGNYGGYRGEGQDQAQIDKCIEEWTTGPVGLTDREMAILAGPIIDRNQIEIIETGQSSLSACPLTHILTYQMSQWNYGYLSIKVSSLWGPGYTLSMWCVKKNYWNWFFWHDFNVPMMLTWCQFTLVNV